MTTEAKTETAWLEKARSLEAITAKFADEADRERRLPAPVLQAVRDGGFFDMMLPRSLGGEQLDFISSMEVFEEIARQDGSIGWNTMFALVSPHFSDYLAADVAREVFEGKQVIMGAQFAPVGKALPVDGGYRLSGRWTFGSGCLDANWMIGGAMVIENGSPRLGPDGQPAGMLFYVPISQYQVHDTWHTMGMRGTGSNDYSCEDVFVPEKLTAQFMHLVTGSTPRPGRGYPRPFMEYAALYLATVPLGIARHAIDEFVRLAATKTQTGATSKLATQPIMHERLGRAEAVLSAGRAYLYETARQIAALPDDAPPFAVRARLAGVQAAQSARTAVDIVHEAAGGTSIYESSPLERCFRDINTVTHHFLIAPGAYAEAGNAMMNPQPRP